MEPVPEVLGDLVVALPAERRIIGRALLHPLMGLPLVQGRFIALVTISASLVEVRVVIQEFGVYQVTLVEIFRPNWRRRTRSALSFSGGPDHGFYHGFHGCLVPVALHAADRGGVGIPGRAAKRKQAEADK